MDSRVIQIKQVPQLQCGICNKTFKRSGEHKSHMLLCEEVHAFHDRYKHHQKERPYEIDSQVNTYIIQKLMSKIDALEQKVSDLQNYVNTKRRNISVIDWLRENAIPTMRFKEWIFNVVSKYDIRHLELLFEKGYVLGHYYAFQDRVSIDDIDSIPIACFKQRCGVFYVYDKPSYINGSDGDRDEGGNGDDVEGETTVRDVENKQGDDVDDDDELQWIPLTHDRFVCMVIGALELGINVNYKKWKQENQDAIMSCEDMFDKSIRYAKNVIGNTKDPERQHSLLKSRIFQYLKRNLKEIIQYEYVG